MLKMSFIYTNSCENRPTYIEVMNECIAAQFFFDSPCKIARIPLKCKTGSLYACFRRQAVSNTSNDSKNHDER